MKKIIGLCLVGCLLSCRYGALEQAMCLLVALHERLEEKRVWRHLALVARMVLEKEEKVKSTAIREMREEVKKMLEEKELENG